jgi:hypothetical protein
MRRLSYANVLGTVAAFVALGGGAYAAGVLPVSDSETGRTPQGLQGLTGKTGAEHPHQRPGR